MKTKKIACLIISISNSKLKNFKKDKFFSPNAVNSFKKWHPDIDMHFITDENFNDYLNELDIKEYHDNLGLLRIHLIKELIKVKKYTKVIMLGADTFTCARLDEFIEDDTTDIICSSGPPYSFIKTDYWEPKTETFTYEIELLASFPGKLTYEDVSFINADVTCFNGLKGVETLYDLSLKYWTNHAEQGGMNYCYINQDQMDISVNIVDFPYFRAKSLYNVRSKGVACGGNQMFKGKLWSGDYNNPENVIIGHEYPTSTYYVNNNKLYTSDNKQIKVFHYAEALSLKTKDELKETLNEIKTMWFNKETLDFLTKECNCNFN